MCRHGLARCLTRFRALRFTPHLEDYMATRAARSALGGRAVGGTARCRRGGTGARLSAPRAAPAARLLPPQRVPRRAQAGIWPAHARVPAQPAGGCGAGARGGRRRDGHVSLFARVVPIDDRTGRWPERTAAYSLGEKFDVLKPEAPVVPSVSVLYDVAPLAVTLANARPPLAVAAVRWAAVAGGVKAVASFVDRALHVV